MLLIEICIYFETVQLARAHTPRITPGTNRPSRQPRYAHEVAALLLICTHFLVGYVGPLAPLAASTTTTEQTARTWPAHAPRPSTSLKRRHDTPTPEKSDAQLKSHVRCRRCPDSPDSPAGSHLDARSPKLCYHQLFDNGDVFTFDYAPANLSAALRGRTLFTVGRKPPTALCRSLLLRTSTDPRPTSRRGRSTHADTPPHSGSPASIQRCDRLTRAARSRLPKPHPQRANRYLRYGFDGTAFDLIFVRN